MWIKQRICSTTWRFMLLSTRMIAFFLSLSLLCMCVFLTEVACVQMSHEWLTFYFFPLFHLGQNTGFSNHINIFFDEGYYSFSALIYLSLPGQYLYFPMNILSQKRNLFCAQICNVKAMYSSIKCEMETIENVAESVFHDLSQDNCAFAALKLWVKWAT